MATYDYPLIAHFGVAYAGRADVYVEVQSVDGTVRIARTNTGVTEWQDDNANDTGIYEKVATLTDTWGPLRVLWDIDGVAGAMAAEVVQPPVALTAGAVTEIVNAIIAIDVDGQDLQEALKIALAILAGKSSGLTDGYGTAVFRDIADTKNRATVAISSDGNRTASTLDGA